MKTSSFTECQLALVAIKALFGWGNGKVERWKTPLKKRRKKKSTLRKEVSSLPPIFSPIQGENRTPQNGGPKKKLSEPHQNHYPLPPPSPKPNNPTIQNPPYFLLSIFNPPQITPTKHALSDLRRMQMHFSIQELVSLNK